MIRGIWVSGYLGAERVGMKYWLLKIRSSGVQVMPWRQRWGSGSLGVGSEVLDGKSLHFQRLLWAPGEGHGNPLQCS